MRPLIVGIGIIGIIGATYRIVALRVGFRVDPQQCNNEVRGTHADMWHPRGHEIDRQNPHRCPHGVCTHVCKVALSSRNIFFDLDPQATIYDNL